MACKCSPFCRFETTTIACVEMQFYTITIPCVCRLAVLATVPRSCPVSSLALTGGVPLSERLAAMVDSTFPTLENLAFYSYWEENDLTDGDPNGARAGQYYYGAMQLLTLCGPRLRKLQLSEGVQQWPTVAFQALHKCTGLTTLELEAGRNQYGPFVGGFQLIDALRYLHGRLSAQRRWPGT